MKKEDFSMKTRQTIAILAVFFLMVATSFSQRPERPDGERPGGERGGERGERGERPGGERGGPPGRGGPGGQRGGPGGMMRMLPVIKALDKDADGTISAEEIASASAALKSIDKDGDGAISPEEMRPDFAAMRGGRDGGDQARGGDAGRGGDSFKDRMMNLDANKDGKLAGDEIPEQMRERMLERADSNGDGVLDAEELEKMAASFQRGGDRRGGEQGKTKGKGKDQDKGGGERPQRPAFE
ncbi:MAG: Ca2+-binding EF-hand superfamily protein [Rhodothermales bacterium]